MKIRVVGKPWRVRFLPKKKFAKKYPGTLGVCLGWKREIRLPVRPLREETITHELVHAYLAELCFGDTDALKRSELEEVFCEMLAKFGAEILIQTDKIWTAYEKARNA